LAREYLPATLLLAVPDGIAGLPPVLDKPVAAGRGQRVGVPGRYLPQPIASLQRSQDLQGEAMKRLAHVAASPLGRGLPARGASEELAKKHACFACHSVDKKLVGPSYKDVAAKYRADKGAEAKLVEKVKKGGTGVWGQVPMPPNAAVPDADLHTLVKWILSQK
jgi:cytochrome c